MRRLLVLSLLAFLCLPSVAHAARLAKPATANPAGSELPPLAPAPADALSRSYSVGAISENEYVIERARTIGDLRAVQDEFGDVGAPLTHSATSILRDLWLRLPSMSTNQRQAARSLLARPTDTGGDGTLEYTTEEEAPICTPNVCVHYVTTTDDAATPTYAASVSVIMEEVWAAEVTRLGWRAPKSDLSASDNGGDGRLDVYLGNAGGNYGYCAVGGNYSGRTAAAYCVIDNDFSSAEFGSVDVIAAAKATAAHEFAHAVQFNYNLWAESYVMEQTATWMEDEVYDDLNDAYGYLTLGALALPGVSIDTGGTEAFPGFEYGSFVWMRYLSERFGGQHVVRDVWERLAAGAYSLEAIAATVGTKGSDFRSSFADFTSRNVDPSSFYEEGAGYEEWQPPVRSVRHSVGTGGVTASAADVDHLSARFISFTPSGGSSSDQLTVSVDMTGTANGSRATLVSVGATTSTQTPISLDDTGAGTATVPFANEVVLVLTNAAPEMNRCDTDGVFSCGGYPAFDDQSYGYAAAVGTSAPTPPASVDGGAGIDTPPTITNLRAAPNPFVRGRKTKVLFSIDEAAKVKMVIAKSTGTKVGAWVMALPEAGDWYTPWNGKTAGGKLVSAGTYKIKLTPTDSAGNVGAPATTSVKVK